MRWSVGHTLVIVESPTKARTIRGFLPKDFKVEASMGHVRDLPNNASEIPAAHKGEKWANLGVNTTNDFEPLYVVPKDKKKTVKELKDALKGADQLLLATDEDREGESISWHLLQLLSPKVPVKRMVFHEITKEAIGRALDQTRELLEKGNKEMLESVGYSITHNYEVEILESKFVILLNQEEVNQIMAAAQQQQAAAAPVAVEAPKLEKKAEKKN